MFQASILGCLQQLVTPASTGPIPSCDPCAHCVHMHKHTHKHRIKMKIKYFKVYLKMPLKFSCFNITIIIVALTDFCKDKLEDFGCKHRFYYGQKQVLKSISLQNALYAAK